MEFRIVCFLRRYLFRSGNSEHPSDRFYNTTVEILPATLPENSIIWSSFNSTTDGFLIIGSFNAFGIAEGTIDPRIGRIKEIRLHMHSDSENWAILSEVNNSRERKISGVFLHKIFVFFLRRFTCKTSPTGDRIPNILVTVLRCVSIL